MAPLTRLSATEVVAMLRSGTVSSLELIDAALERIREVDPIINALPTLCVDRARAKAMSFERKAARRNRPPNFLHGLPIAVKDNVDVAGVRTTYGSTIFAGHVPTQSDVVVETLERNGAIVLAKSNTPEFAAGGNTFNDVFGVTRNPWDVRLTAGGSSGGSAAALASGEVWLATGNDLAGSVRLPASFCSVVGLRPTPGRIARTPGKQLYASLSVEGCLGRCVADVALMLDAQVGASLHDPLSLPAPATTFSAALRSVPRPRKIAFSPDLNLAPVDAEVADICRRAAARLTEVGIAVEEDCPDLSDAQATFEVLRAHLFVGRVGWLLEQERERLKGEIVWNVEKGLALSPRQIAWAEEARANLYKRMIEFFERYDVLMCPTAVAPPFEVGTRYLSELSGVRFKDYISWLILTFAITLTSCPAISVPCGFTLSGRPVGLQIIAPPRAEHHLLALASLVEEMVGLRTHLPVDPRHVQAEEVHHE